ncbi:MAG: hypothetical protein COB24_14645 [Hyphomicrobiales bacterium]|nr:MAG: hypothetical protein COB24_14645 [Hyphomicrobiales bacterium]
MKKILLATSALVAMSGVAVAGDIPAAPMAPMVAGFTVTATGSATIFGYYNGTAVVAPDTETGIGGDFEGTIKASKTTDNGSDVYVKIVFDNGDDTEVLVGYKSAVGEFKAGVIGGEDEHDIEAPGVSYIDIGDELEDGDKGLTFASADLSLYTDFAPSASASTAEDFSVTYTSPEFGGFQLGVGVDGIGNIDAAIVGSFAAGDASVKVGARYIATRAAGLDLGVVTAGASTTIAGFTIAGEFAADLADDTLNAYTVGAEYSTGAFTLGANYSDLVESADTASVQAYAQYNNAGLNVIVNGELSLDATGATPDAWTAAAGATYEFTTEMTAGATVLASGNSAVDDAEFTASAGVDYALNSNVTIGAGLGYNGTTEIFGAAAGLKVSF